MLDHELLELILFLALPRRDTKSMAAALMARFGGFAAVVAAPPDTLAAAVRGLGEAGVAALKTVEAGVRRLAHPAVPERPLLDTGGRLRAYVAASMDHGRPAPARVLFLDAGHRLIADEALDAGGAGASPPEAREVVRRALELGAANLALVRPEPAPSRSGSDPAARSDELRAAAAAYGILLHEVAPACRPRRCSKATRDVAHDQRLTQGVGGCTCS